MPDLMEISFVSLNRQEERKCNSLHIMSKRDWFRCASGKPEPLSDMAFGAKSALGPTWIPCGYLGYVSGKPASP
jgi:hypothetical protein